MKFFGMILKNARRNPIRSFLTIASLSVSLSLAMILISGALRILRLTATRLWFLDPETPAWRLPLVP